ncbi:MAG TPA: hypothetical protein VMW44_01090 [Candidatus Bathyarchaeia archaeon]|nr:hypothetical protein [Candidatus Bathyarchaeia archaeon]
MKKRPEEIFRKHGGRLRMSEAITEPFIDAKQIQWTTFWKRLQQDQVPVSFREVTTAVDGFLAPVVAAISSGKPSPTNWIASGPWS